MRIETCRGTIFVGAYSTFGGFWRRVGYNSGCNSRKNQSEAGRFIPLIAV